MASVKAPPETSALLMSSDELEAQRKKPQDKPGILYLYEDEEDDSLLYNRMSKKRSTSLIVLDSVVLIVEILQFLALIQSMALRWTWPDKFVRAANFVLLFNLDIWDFIKVDTVNVYKSVQGRFTPSADVPIYYFNIILGWCVVLVVAGVIYITIYCALRYRMHPYMLVRIARLQHVLTVFIQLVTLPMGVVVARLFHCPEQATMDVDNTITCSGGKHWAIMGVAIVFVVATLIPFPVWLFIKTRQEIYILWMSRKKHEAHLQLKEIEYRQGLNLLWVVRAYHIFASFNRWSIHYRAVMHLFKLALLLIYAFIFNSISSQAGASMGVFATLSVLLCLLRPYRVTCFNALAIFSYFTLFGLTLYGTVMTSVPPTQVESPWMLYPYNLYMLGSLMGLLGLAILLFVMYVVAREIICYKRCCKEHLWPTLTRHGLTRLSPHTRKYMKAALRGQMFLDKIQKEPPMFARADELARQIEIINLYCREAEYIRDITHRTLLNLLDTMIEAHSYIVNTSLFADTVKESIQETAAEFMKLLPMFTRRLTQREYDFILVSPLKKRLLLKMYCLGVFLNGRAEKVAKQKLSKQALEKLWSQPPAIREFEFSDAYYEDMYPAPLEEPACRPESALSLDSDEEGEVVTRADVFDHNLLHTQTDFWEVQETAATEQAKPPQESESLSDYAPDNDDLPAYSLIDLEQDFIEEIPVISVEQNGRGADNPTFETEPGADNPTISRVQTNQGARKKMSSSSLARITKKKVIKTKTTLKAMKRKK